LLNSEFRLPDTPEVKLPQVSIVAALIVITSHGLIKALLLHRHSDRQA
jgi:hypothetical protein